MWNFRTPKTATTSQPATRQSAQQRDHAKRDNQDRTHRRCDMRGFSLIELLVVIAIIAILAAIGGPMYADYLEGVKLEEAKKGLASIYMMQEQHYSMNGSYYIGNACCSVGSSSSLIQNLFGGKQSLNLENYWYATQRNGSNPDGYIAYARKQSGTGTLCINENNQKSWVASGAGAPRC